MRDCSKNRAGYDRVLMAVAATFLAVSATSALAQAGPARSSAAELAIDAAIPRPEPANVPPPTASDFKLDTTAIGARCGEDHRAQPRPRSRSRRRRTSPPSRNRRTPRPPLPHPPPAAADRNAAAEPVKAASIVPQADQPVADKLREMLGAKSSRYFDRKGERAAVEKFYTAREFAPVWTQSRRADRRRQGRHRAAQGCRLRRPECRRLSGAGFHGRDHARTRLRTPN